MWNVGHWGATVWIGLITLGLEHAAAPRGGPLPLPAVTEVVGHAERIPVSLSPDGTWVAHTFISGEMLPTDDSRYYSKTGISLVEGPEIRHARVTSVRTGEAIDLAPPECSSWGATWSPDGSQLAFFSDEGGEPGLWSWVLATRKRHRIGKTLAWPRFGFEIPRWLDGGHTLLCPIVPPGISVAQARAGQPVPAPGPGSAGTSVTVVYSPARPSHLIASAPFTSAVPPVLALVDAATGEATPCSSPGYHPWYAASPDNRYLAWTVNHATEPNSQQNTFDLFVRDRARGENRVVASALRLNYGMTVTWSPDSRQLACLTGGQLAPSECVVISVEGTTRRFGLGTSPETPGFAKEQRPLWDADSQTVWCLHSGVLWRLALASGQASVQLELPDEELTGIVSAAQDGRVWPADNTSSAWITARNRRTHHATLRRIDLLTGKSEKIRDEPSRYLTPLGCDAGGNPAQIILVAEDVAHPLDLWRVDPVSGETRQVSHLNLELERSAAGQSQLIEWQTSDGQSLQGALLLPPTHREGQRHPLVIWVYGGALGSNSLHQYGLLGATSAFNAQVLASRGYAVFFPDVPLRLGQPYRDLPAIVLPALDRLIALGVVDPQRMAVFGQSFGSYCALSLITQTDRFKAAVISAVSVHPDLVSAYLAGNSGYFEHGQGGIGGTPWSNRDAYLQNSPIYAFDRIKTPLLIADGTNDGRGPQNAEAVLNALTRLGKTAEYRLYAGEGHVISQPAHVIDFWERRLSFLAEHLDLVLDAEGAVVMDGDHAKSRKASANSPP